MDKEKLTKELKRAYPGALVLASMGVDPACVKKDKTVKLKKNIRRLLTKYSKNVFMKNSTG